MNQIPTTLVGRRQFFQLVGAYGCAGVLATTSWADSRSSAWSSQVIRLDAFSDRHKAPVVTALALHPERPLLAIAGDDHLVRVWNLSEMRCVHFLEDHTDWVRALNYSPDGNLLASAGNDHRLILWDSMSGAKIREQLSSGQTLTAICFACSSDQIASVGLGNTLQVFDVSEGTLVRELNCPSIDMRALTFSPCGQHIAAGGRNGRIRVWDSRSGDVVVQYSVHQQRIRGLAFSPDSRWLASCGEDRKVYVFSMDTRDSFMLPRRRNKVLSLVFCGNDRLATGGSDNLVRIWDLAAGIEIDSLSGHSGSVAALAYNGELLASAGYDTTVRLWQQPPNIAGEGGGSIRRVGDTRR